MKLFLALCVILCWSYTSGRPDLMTEEDESENSEIVDNGEPDDLIKEDSYEPFKRNRRTPKEIIPGGVSGINIDDPGVQEASKFALSSISEGSASSHQLGLVKVVSAKRQVVAGVLYTIVLQAAKTDCTKAAPKPVCSVMNDSAHKDDPDFNECTVKVWDQAWRNPRFQITELKCSRENANSVTKN